MLLTESEFARTQAKIAKLNNRAIKRGWTGRITVTGEETTVDDIGPSGLKVTRLLIDTTITGKPPKYDGWTFLARLEFDKDSGLVVFAAPGAPTLEREALRAGECDHCGIKRYRKNIYVVANESGDYSQVGSTCIKDFLGWNVNPVWIDDSEVSEESLFGEGGYGHDEPTYSVETVLAAAWAVIQEFGYVRATDYAGQPTKYTVADVLDPRNPKARELAQAISARIPDAMAQAKHIRAWVLSDEFKGDSDYVVNLKNIARGEFVRTKNFGFLVSAPQAWAKSVERDLIRKAQTGDICNEWNGETGDKLELTVTLKSIRPIESDWGTMDLYTFAGEDNRVYKWFSSRIIFTETDGEPVKIKGTVKKHDEYNGLKATVLTRCKVI